MSNLEAEQNCFFSSPISHCPWEGINYVSHTIPAYEDSKQEKEKKQEFLSCQ